ncbi:hypothetical protein [Agrobacterium sp.]|uniref:hypothetical protein n=1 Tax=Agrobacterium sp. TaxID=361 RepID=UPI0028AB952E|nr:hypothetical protein [Agrobacterium sp.]
MCDKTSPNRTGAARRQFLPRILETFITQPLQSIILHLASMRQGHARAKKTRTCTTPAPICRAGIHVKKEGLLAPRQEHDSRILGRFAKQRVR